MKKISKFLSLILRHNPQKIGLQLDHQGWASIDELINKSQSFHKLTYNLILNVVKSNDKQRFKISDDGRFIRANQGHSISIDLNLPVTSPPDSLFHGTASRFLESILAQGLKPMNRHHVHLSTDISVARSVGNRYGKPVILIIDTKAMDSDGCEFFVSENNVWLTKSVPVKYLTLDQESRED